MAKIKTRDALKEYIKRRLGYPLVKVELTDDMLDDCIDRAIEVYSEYGYDGTEESTLLVELEDGKLDYKLDDRIIAVRSLRASSMYNSFITIPAGYSLAINPMNMLMMNSISNIDITSMSEKMAQMSTLRSLFDVNVNYNYNYNTKILSFFEKPTSTVAILEISMEYEPKEIDNIYGNWWIKKRAEGEAWKTWGAFMGKYSGTLVNGTEINYADMSSRGEQMIQETDEELDGLFEPLGIYVF